VVGGSTGEGHTLTTDEAAMQSALLSAVTVAATEAMGNVTLNGTFYYEVDDEYCITAEFASTTIPLTKYTTCMAPSIQYDEATMQSMLLDAVTNAAEGQMGEAVASNVDSHSSARTMLYSLLLSCNEN